MNEELKKLMGDSYKDDLTIEDIANFMKGKNFADLSKGGYVDVNKHQSEINDLKKQLSDKDNTIKSKMSEDELKENASKEKDDEIERLKALLSANILTSNTSIATGNLAESISLLGIKEDDSELKSFIDGIVSEDTTKTTQIAKYVNKLIKDAYDKGGKDSTKDAMGNFGKQNNGNTKADNEVGKLGKELAQNSVNNKKFDYFKKQ